MTPDPHTHCWHEIYRSKLINAVYQFCCWCGEQRVVQLRGIHTVPGAGEHGPYLQTPIAIGPSEFKESQR